MDTKIVISNVGISETSSGVWERTHIRYNRIHVPLNGRVYYHDTKGDLVLHEGMAYLMINSYAPNFELISGHHYYHLYIDFRTNPPLLNRGVLEIDLSEDVFSLYLIKAIQTLIQEKHREGGGNENLLRDDPLFWQVKKLLQVMLVHLQKKYGVSVLENPQIEEAIRYIEKNYSENVRIDDIATALYINKRTLLRLFDKYMGMSPYQYLTQCRIEHAVEVLRQGKSVTETAYLCGYQNETAFRMAFKRVMGGTPKSTLKL